MLVLLGPILQTGVCFFRHKSVVDHHIRHIESTAALGEVDGAVHADILVSFVIVAVAHNEHLAKIHFLACLAEDFVLKERDSGETPAGS